MRRSIRCPFKELMRSFVRTTAFILTLSLALPVCALAAPTPAPKPGAPKRIDLTKVQPKALLPKVRLRAEFTVETNKLGQVTRVRKVAPSHNPTFDAQTYGNALQAFIRTPEGNAVPGTYKLSYDYDPKTGRVKRDVQLVRAGGVNENARGAALDMLSKVHKRPSPSPPANSSTPAPRASVDNSRLPDLNSIMKPTPSPH
jgi:hypothetical protein